MFKDQNGFVTIDDLVLPESFWLEQEPDYTRSEGVIGVEYSPSSHHIIFQTGQMVEALVC